MTAAEVEQTIQEYVQSTKLAVNEAAWLYQIAKRLIPIS